MTAPAVTVQFDEHVAAGARRLERHRIKRMPALDAVGWLAGIVGRGDLLRVFLRSDEEILADIDTLLVHMTECCALLGGARICLRGTSAGRAFRPVELRPLEPMVRLERGGCWR